MPERRGRNTPSRESTTESVPNGVFSGRSLDRFTVKLPSKTLPICTVSHETAPHTLQLNYRYLENTIT